MTMHNSRRKFLKLISAAGLSAATLRLTRPAWAENTPKRIIFMVIPDGMRPEHWHAQGTETVFTLPAMTQPLERVKQHCLFLSGINMYGSGSTHEGGIAKLLTGTSGQTQNLAVSLDYYLADQLRSQTVKPHLNLNIVPLYHDKHISYDHSGIGVVAEKNPLAVYDSLFANSTTITDPAVIRRLNILNQNRNEVSALRSMLGTTEQLKLDEHLQSLVELENRINLSAGSCPSWGFNPTGFTVTRTNQWDNPEYLDNQQMGLIADLHMDIAVHALACDLTRVVTLKWNNTVNDQAIPEAGTSTSCHQASHEGGNSFNLIKAWYVERYTQLIEQLASHSDGSGTLLDNTLIFLGSELGHSNNHDHNNMPFILAGGSAGGFNTGRSLVYDGIAHNKLLVSMAQFMDAPINQFGTEDSSPGPLPGLLL